MTEPLRQSSSLRFDRKIRLTTNTVIATCVEHKASSSLWLPPEARPWIVDVKLVGEPSLGTGVKPGDRVIISKFVGIRLKYYGEDALMFREDEVLAKIVPDEE